MINPDSKCIMVIAAILLTLTLTSGCANSKPGNAPGKQGEKPPGEEERVKKSKKMDYTEGLKLWKEILVKYVDEKGLVGYLSLKENKEDAKKLRSYIGCLEAVDPEKLNSREEKLAFWINCYNAVTINGVLQHYPVDTVKDVKDFWHITVVRVGDKEYSLGTIENSVLRSLAEPRMHWAIVRASKSSAGLLNEPYDAPKLEEQLAGQEKELLVGRKQVYVDKKRKKLMLSPFFYWYGEDFIKKAGTKLEYVKKYLSEEDLDFIEDYPLSMGYIKPDWSLNKQEK